MAQSGRKTERLCINWERAFDLYLNAIACDNEVFWVQATSKLAKLSKHAPEDLLARTVPILVELLRKIPSTDLSPSIQEAAARCLKIVACQGEGRLAVLIGESGAIPSILSLLTHSDGSLRRALLKCLRNIVTFAADNRVIVATHGGLQIILNLLNTCSDDLKRYLLEILSALALLREVRGTILISGGVGFLVESARCGNLDNQLYDTDRRKYRSRRHPRRNDKRNDQGPSSRGLMSKSSFDRSRESREAPRLLEYNFNIDVASIVSAIGRFEKTKWPRPLQIDPA